jgi:hypothetical protein
MNSSIFQLLTVTAAIALAGCGSSHIAPPVLTKPELLNPVPNKNIQNNPTAIWNFTFDKQTHSYQSITSTILQTQPNSVPSQLRDIPDSIVISTTSQFLLSIDRKETLVTLVSGYLNRIQSTSSSRIHIDNQQLALPLAFSGSITSGRLLLTPTNPTTDIQLCKSPINPRLGDIRSILISLPHQLQTGSTWTDTISTSMCSGIDLPTQTTTIRTYRMVEQRDTNPISLFLKTKESSYLTGLGSQGEHQVQIAGQGSGSAEFLISAVTGVISTFHLTQSLTLQIYTSGKTSRILQTINQDITILN